MARFPILLIASLVVLLSCSSPPDYLIDTWPWRGGFSLTIPGATSSGLRIHRSFTNISGERLLCTEISWEEVRVNRMESYMAKDVKYTILDNAGSTVLSNRFLFMETEAGAPRRCTARVRAGFRTSQAYRALIRKRLDELYVKPYGTAASGRARFVEEQLVSTWKGELASLPDLELRWRFGQGGWNLTGRDHGARVQDKGRLVRRLLLPGGMARRVAILGKQGGGREPVSLLLPWMAREALDASLGVSVVPNGYVCTLRYLSNDALLGVVTFTTGMRPGSVRAGGILLRPSSPGP